MRSQVRSLVGSLAAACLLVAACFGGDDESASPDGDARPTPAPCRPDLLAGWQAGGLAVLWAERLSQEGSAVLGLDVHTGQVRSYCELPELRTLGLYTIPMRQGGLDYPASDADDDLMLRTQWFSPDFRWFGAPGLPLVEVGKGPVEVVLPGTLTGVGRDVVLVRTEAGAEAGWCTLPLPPRPDAPCAPLPPGAGAGSFVIGVDGEPVWLPADAVTLAFGDVQAFAVTDGRRIYRADSATAAVRRDRSSSGVMSPSIDVDPSGLGGLPTLIGYQPIQDLSGWVSVTSVGPDGVRTSHHRTEARPGTLTGVIGEADSVSRATADAGRVAVSARLDPGPEFGDPAETHFRAVVDGTDRVIDLTRERGLRCPVRRSLCRIVAWPDGSLDARGAGSG